MNAASTTVERPRPSASAVWAPSWPYRDALAWMQARWAEVSAGGPMIIGVGTHAPAVVTLGRHTPDAQIADAEALAARGVAVVRTDRGGGATLHQPGQLVLYPVVDLKRLRLSVPDFTQVLLAAARDLLADHGLEGELIDGLPGVYVRGRKVASVGFRSRRRVVTHGLAVNVCNDLSLFAHIHACGEADREVTSIAAERSGANTASDAQHETRDLRRQADRLVNFFVDRAVLRCEAVTMLTPSTTPLRGQQPGTDGDGTSRGFLR